MRFFMSKGLVDPSYLFDTILRRLRSEYFTVVNMNGSFFQFLKNQEDSYTGAITVPTNSNSHLKGLCL